MRKPAARVPRGLPGAGRVRLIELPGRSHRLRAWLVVSDVPLDVYGERAINSRLGDLDWVSRAAVAHEAVVESFIAATALLPMKLFTIFTNDDRAVEDMQRQRRRIDATVKRVAHRVEWGVRVVLDRSKLAAPRAAVKASGAGYLTAKKAQRDATVEQATRARVVLAGLYDDLAAIAVDATRRPASDLTVKGGPLLLDAAFLVARAATARFTSAVRRQAKAHAAGGYAVSLSGPWPPYSFMRE
jgi:hypothetical protein